MRGKQLYSTIARLRDGITPADAGKTRAENKKTALPEDHPRGCGENGMKSSAR